MNRAPTVSLGTTMNRPSYALLTALLAALPLQAQLTVTAAPATTKLGPETVPPTALLEAEIESLTLDCAKNESESGQVVVRSHQAVKHIRFACDGLTGPAGATLGPDACELRRVAWVDVNAPYDPEEASEHPDWRPDPLPPVGTDESFDLEPNRNLIFWWTVTVPTNAAAGLYQGTIRVSSDGGTATLPVKLTVHNFALPARPILQSMVGLSAGNLYKAHGCQTPEQKEAIIRRYFDAYLRARLSPFLYAPGTMAFAPLPNASIHYEFVMDANEQPTGEAKLDFTGFDREGVRYLDQPRSFSAFNLMPYVWARRQKDGQKDLYLRFSDSKGKVVEGLQADGTPNPVYDQLVVTVFRQITSHLADRGWLDRAIYYVTDEPSEDDVDLLQHICKLIRQADPRLRTALTYDPANRPRLAELVDDQRKSLISVWIPYCSYYREDVAAKERAKGARYWLYDVKEQALITHSGVTNRGIFWDVWERNAGGYLYYLSTYWGRDSTPWDRPSFLLPGVSYKYNHGDGYFFYPPRREYNPPEPILDELITTQRWELMREGAEDYDYLRILTDLTDKAEAAKSPLAAVGRRALAEAHRVAEALGSSAVAFGIRDFQFEALAGWSSSATEGWLHHPGSARSDLPITLTVPLPDGRYELDLGVYNDPDYRDHPYSEFLIDGRRIATSQTGIKGSTRVSCGVVEVKGGACRFTLSSVSEAFGLVVYRAYLKRQGQSVTADLYHARSHVALAIEALAQE